ncbi:MAG: C25 family cysteine peptidase [bacterium]
MLYLLNSFSPLIEWKNQKGVRADIVSLESIISSYPGRDDMEKVREFIKDYHANHGLIYCVLAGDDDNFGSRKIRANNNDSSKTRDFPSDLYFSDIFPYNKDWDANTTVL